MEMENLNIEETKYTPKITFDSTCKYLSIKGKSYPENAFEFYKEINVWLREYFKTEVEKTKINIELTYLNSSSLKAYFDMFDIFELAVENGSSLEIFWTYEADDDIIEEMGEDFKEDFDNLNITLVSQNSD